MDYNNPNYQQHPAAIIQQTEDARRIAQEIAEAETQRRQEDEERQRQFDAHLRNRTTTSQQF
jgi:hypothetical protein